MLLLIAKCSGIAPPRRRQLLNSSPYSRFVHRSVSKQGVVVAVFLALLSIAMAIYTPHA